MFSLLSCLGEESEEIEEIEFSLGPKEDSFRTWQLRWVFRVINWACEVGEWLVFFVSILTCVVTLLLHCMIRSYDGNVGEAAR